MQGCPAQACAAPAELRFHPGRKRPSNGAGESGDQRDPRDGTAGMMAIKTHQTGKGSFVEARPHCDANDDPGCNHRPEPLGRSEEHTSELQSLMRIPYDV